MPDFVATEIPAGFLDAEPNQLADLLGGPVLFDLPGRHPQPLFASVLLHGNEVTGLLAAQEILRRHSAQGLPRRLLLFIGNVAAAAAGVRTLPDQLDLNRVWPGTEYARAPETELMRAVTDWVAGQNPLASIDIHNNTGTSPHYACVNRLDGPFLQLARLFSRTVIFFEKPLGVQSAAMATICPAVTVECGHSGDPAATARAADFIEACLTVSHLPDARPPASDIDLLRTFAIAKVPAEFSFSFGDGAGDGSDGSTDIRFRPDLDQLNFSELDRGALFGAHRLGDRPPLTLEAEPNLEIPDYFEFGDGRIRLAEPAIPAMLTRDPDAVRLDCLGYLMHRIDYSGRRQTD